MVLIIGNGPRRDDAAHFAVRTSFRSHQAIHRQWR